MLFLDTFGGHSANKGQLPYKFSNITLQYYPPNCTSFVRPMDQGIIQTAKVGYRKQIIAKKLDSIEDSYKMESITVLDAIQLLDESWRNVKSYTIQNCFKKAGK